MTDPVTNLAVAGSIHKMHKKAIGRLFRLSAGATATGLASPVRFVSF